MYMEQEEVMTECRVGTRHRACQGKEERTGMCGWIENLTEGLTRQDGRQYTETHHTRNTIVQKQKLILGHRQGL